MPHKRRIVTIGITGGIGSGKSEVCRIFEKLGVPVLYADDLAKKISGSDPRVKQELRDLLGDNAYTSDGLLNRAYVASQIFSSKALQKKVNAIVHPRVEKSLREKIAELEHTGTPVAIVEAALIYEAGLEKMLDAVLVVDSDEETRIRRVMERDGVSRGSVLGRVNAQWDPSKKLRKADFFILNNGTTEELEQRVIFFRAIFQHLSGTRA